MEQTIIDAIGKLGFPVVAFFLMWNMASKTIKENTNAIKDLKDTILQTLLNKEREKRDPQ